MPEPKITPYSVSEGKVTAVKVEDSIGNEIIETEPFSIENIPIVAHAIVSFANRRRQLEVFRRTYEEGQALFVEAETNLKQAIQQANKGLTSAGFFELGDKEPAGRGIQRLVNSPAPEQEQPIPQEHGEGCACPECAEKRRQEFEQQIVEKKEETEAPEPEVKAEASEEKKEEKSTEEAPLIKIPEPSVEKTAEQWSEEIYDKLMQDLHTNFKGKTLKREEITQKLTGEYGVPDALVQEVVSIIHERAKKEKKISEPKGEGIFGSIAKKLRKKKD